MIYDIQDSKKFPIGVFIRPTQYNGDAVAKAIELLEVLPQKLLRLVSGISEVEWEKTYRPGSWTLRQVLNHLTDANVNNYTRFKFALTEDNPTIKPYLESLWSALPDASAGPVNPTLELLVAIHAKWGQSLRTMGEGEFRRTFFHPTTQRIVPLFEAVAMYAWHSEHHLAHIRLGLES